ncbi:unnamed protein product [Peronospora belbahrii]|nr:unnamed protein product [Peronospora belbahrii]
MAGYSQQDDQTMSTQIYSEVSTNLNNEVVIADLAPFASALDTNGCIGHTTGTETTLITTLVEQFNSVEKQQDSALKLITEDKQTVESRLYGDNYSVDGNSDVTDVVLSRATVELPIEFHNQSRSNFPTYVVDKSKCKGLSLVKSMSRNEIAQMVEIVSTNTKRTYEKEERYVKSRKLNPLKRIAFGNEDSVAPSYVGQTTDEIVGDSSDDVEMSEPVDEEAVFYNDRIGAKEDGKRAHENFWCNLTVKQQVDVYDICTKEWFAAKIEHLDNKRCTVHYMGKNSKYNEIIQKVDSYRIMPRATKAAKAWAKCQVKVGKHPRRVKEKLASFQSTNDKHKRGVQEKHAASQSINDKLKRAYARDRELAPTFVQTGLTRSGRVITQRIQNGALKPKAPGKKKKDMNAVQSNIPEEDLCGVCGEIEDDDLTDRIFCDGGCLKSYHFSCLGIESTPEEEKWLCEQCRTNEQLCFACGRNGTINEKGGVFRCSAVCCGKYFHQKCVDDNKMSRRFGG